MELKLERLNLLNRRYARGLLLSAFSLLLISLSLVPPAGYALSLPATAGFNPAVQVPLQNANTTTTSSATTTTATASTTSTPTNSSIVAPANTGGGSNDWVANAPAGTLIHEVIGTLATTGLTSETSRASGAADVYSLQINTNTGKTFPVTYFGKNGGGTVNGWEQFMFDNNPATSSISISIEYWLNGWEQYYCPTKDKLSGPGCCPSENPPGGGGGWFNGDGVGDCTAYSFVETLPTLDVPAKNLGLLTFYAIAYASEDEVIVCGLTSGCISNQVPGSVLNLYKHWTQSEFNVFGQVNGDQAIFNSGTTIAVNNDLLNGNGVSFGTANCVIGGATLESNNLNLASSCLEGATYVGFTESNALETLTTGVDSGSGSVSPNCPNGCSEEFGSGTFFKTPVTVTATASSGWQFAAWSTQTGITCSTNPCTFAMPLNAVTLKAAFDPVMTVSYAILGGVPPGPPFVPTFSYVQGGVSKSLTLTTTPVRVAADIGSEWSVSPNFGEIVCIGSTCTATGQAWVDTGATNGKFTGGSTIVFTYQHQFYLTMQVNPSGTGSTTPSTSGWYNAGQKVTIGATAKSGYNFLSWAGSGAGSYSAICSVAGCSSAAAVTMNAPITETANFEQTSS